MEDDDELLAYSQARSGAGSPVMGAESLPFSFNLPATPAINCEEMPPSWGHSSLELIHLTPGGEQKDMKDRGPAPFS